MLAGCRVGPALCHERFALILHPGIFGRIFVILGLVWMHQCAFLLDASILFGIGCILNALNAEGRCMVGSRAGCCGRKSVS